MSDLCMYELEDIVWDDFCQSDDHIVPHPSDEQDNESSIHGNNRKRPRHEVTCISSDAKEPVGQQKTEQESLALYGSRNKMLEKEIWSDKADGVIHSSSDGVSIKEISIVAPDSTRTSSHCFKDNLELVGNELCTDDSILNDKSTAVNNSFGYPLDHISEPDNGLSFFSNSHEEKDSSDLLYYGWPDIGNFEDVDRMFRSCDSTFGLGASNEDDLGWFSSPDAIGESGDALKSDFKFSRPESSEPKCRSETRDPSRLDGTSNESSMQNTSVIYQDNSWPSSKGGSSPVRHLSFSNGSSSSRKDGFMPGGQEIEFRTGVQHKFSDNNHAKNVKNKVNNVAKKQLKPRNQSEMDRKDHYLDNGSFFSIDNMPEVVQEQRQALDSNSFGYFQSDIPYMHSEYNHPSDQTSVHPAPSAVKLKNSSLASVSPKGSSAPNQLKSIKGPNNPSFQVISVASDETGEMLHNQRSFRASFDNKNVDLAVQTSDGGPTLVEKNVHYSGKEFENHNDTGVKLPIPAELGSSVVQESSSMKSGLDDISVEATSFRQLQVVMERLDLRTKLCIRDSLYRLARSAEQRHTCSKLSGGCPDDGDAGGALAAEGKHKYSGFMDMETDTNPIDRSVAHLLFHRPSDTTATPVNDSLSFNSPAPIHGSISSSPLMADEFVKLEETAGETDRKGSR